MKKCDIKLYGSFKATKDTTQPKILKIPLINFSKQKSLNT